MNSFCRKLGQFLFEKFDIEVDVFVSKKKKLVHMSLIKPLISYEFFKEKVEQIRRYWSERKKLFPGYRLSYPKTNQNLK